MTNKKRTNKRKTVDLERQQEERKQMRREKTNKRKTREESEHTHARAHTHTHTQKKKDATVLFPQYMVSSASHPPRHGGPRRAASLWMLPCGSPFFSCSCQKKTPCEKHLWRARACHRSPPSLPPSPLLLFGGAGGEGGQGNAPPAITDSTTRPSSGARGPGRVGGCGRRLAA